MTGTEDIDDSVPLHELIEEGDTPVSDCNETDACNSDILRDTTNFSDDVNNDMDVDKKNRSALDSSPKISGNDVS